MVTTESLPPPTGTSGVRSVVPTVVRDDPGMRVAVGPVDVRRQCRGQRIAVGELAESTRDELA